MKTIILWKIYSSDPSQDKLAFSIFTSLCDVKTSLTYVTMYVCGLSPHFVLLTSEHFYYMNERVESKLMETDIGLLDKSGLHELELNC